ncbi:MAG: TlpA disulfide reductase family protein [Ekhidna sp.]|uniref:TlpA family protein disulfide reductase n=1 Tax=Ekhidna sp. TaxID=2608089 RepID=UPI0032ED22D9
MRAFIIVSLLLVVGASAFSQAGKERFEKYSDGKQLSSDSWMITLEGDTVFFSKYQGKWVLIDYWSVTCKPCIKELPALNQYAQENSIENLEIIGVSVDPTMERWVKLSPKRNLSFPSYFAGRSVDNDLFGLNLSLVQDGETFTLSTTLPRYTLVGPDGVIKENEIELKPSDPEFAKYISSMIK